MTYDYKQTRFSKTILGGLFAGLMACGVTQVYNIAFRNFTDFSMSDIVNVSSLIFIPIIILEVASVVYFFMAKYKWGVPLYIILSLISTIIFVMKEIQIQRSPDAVLSSQFRGLFIGITLIIGLIATFVLPYVTEHDILLEE